MTEEEKDRYWQAAIRDAENLDKNAKKTDKYIAHMTDALVLTLQAMYTNDINENYTNWERDKEDLNDLVLKMAPYAIHRNDGMLRVNLTAEYDEISDILREVFKDDRVQR